MLAKNYKEEGHEYFFIGNFYGFHDGYDGSVFAVGGISPTLVASNGRIPHIFIKKQINLPKNESE